MSAYEKLKFSENLSSRLCHDLITPMGAINTGLELLLEQEDLKSQESQEIMELIRQSAQTSSNRLGFFRVAFGTSGQNISMGDSQHLVERYYEKSKLKLHWPNDMDPHYTMPCWGRLMINATLWVGECAPRGGDLYITPPSPERERLEVRLEAPQIIFHDGTMDAINGKLQIDDLSPRTIHSALLQLVIEDLDARLSIEQPQPTELLLKIA